jgi:CheY-like chemotaxis protein
MSAERGDKTLLVVDDDPDGIEVLRSVLEQEGWSVVSAANGEEALDRLRSASRLPHGILLDLMMPVMNGWEFCAAQKREQRLAEIPVIVLSAATDAKSTAQGLGAVDYLEKPFDLNALLRAVARLA